MYSPRIYESQIPCLYHAAKSMDIPMTQLTNAFIYYGLIAGNYGQTATELLPQPNEVLPVNIRPKVQIFHPNYASIADYVINPPSEENLNPLFQTLRELDNRTMAISLKSEPGGKDELIPF